MMNAHAKVNGASALPEAAGSAPLRVNGAAGTRNVAAFNIMMEKVVSRHLQLPGLACFFGPSGYGKSKSAVFAANRYRAAYVECGQFTTARSLMISILKELGIARPRGTITEMIEDAIRIMAGDIRRPLIIDEAHWIAKKQFVDLARELHDKSAAPVILIGEETLPTHLENFERVHNRILEWVAAVPCDDSDFALLARAYCPGLSIAPDLARAILEATRGNTRRIVVNLAKVEEIAAVSGTKTLDLAAFGGTAAVIGSKAPARRPA